MGRPCDCDRYTPGEPFVRGRDCARCWLWHNDPDNPVVRQWRGDTATLPPPVPPRPPCLHEFRLVRKAGCACPGLDVYECGKGRGEVTRKGACAGCPDHEPDG